jgi:hypothetical protein
MNENLEDQDILLIKEKDSGELKAIKEIDSKNRKLETVSPKSEDQPSFMKFDRHGNTLDNFLENFNRKYFPYKISIDFST